MRRERERERDRGGKKEVNKDRTISHARDHCYYIPWSIVPTGKLDRPGLPPRPKSASGESSAYMSRRSEALEPKVDTCSSHTRAHLREQANTHSHLRPDLRYCGGRSPRISISWLERARRVRSPVCVYLYKTATHRLCWRQLLHHMCV